MYFYFRRFFPGLGPEVILALSSLIFGLNHLYQGYRGVLGTTLVGVLLGMLYYQFGGLLVPMVVHALIDLRIIFILTPERLRTLAEGTAPA